MSELSGRRAEGLCAQTGAAHGFFGKAACVSIGDPAAKDAATGTQVDPTLLYPSVVRGPFLSPGTSVRHPDAYSNGEC